MIEGRSIHSVAVYQSLILHPDNDHAAGLLAQQILDTAARWRLLPDLTAVITDDTETAVKRAETCLRAIDVCAMADTDDEPDALGMALVAVRSTAHYAGAPPGFGWRRSAHSPTGGATDQGDCRLAAHRCRPQRIERPDDDGDLIGIVDALFAADRLDEHEFLVEQPEP